ncbi:MAG: hemolysin family protein, partial [Acidobacteriota bacterium]
MDDLIALGVTACLILLNGIFVAAEFAIVGAPRQAIDARAAQGHATARMVSRILHNPLLQDRYIATAQLGITLASLGLGMYGEHTLAEWLLGVLGKVELPGWLAAHTIASITAVAILTYFHIVIGEMVPKSMALQYAERSALWIAPIMFWTKMVFYPFVVGLNGLGNTMLRLMRIDRQLSSGYYITPEELDYVIKESQAAGVLRGESGRMLRDLIEFGDLTAAEVMVPRVQIVGIPTEASPEQLRETVRGSRHSRYPVFKGDLDHIVGIVHIKDLFRLIMEDEPLGMVNLRSAPFVPETAKLEVVLQAMHKKRTHLAVVMDEYGGT